MINFIQKNLLFLFLIVCASPIGLTSFPTLHGKYPGSLLIIISTLLSLTYKTIWIGKTYFVTIIFFVISIIPSILLIPLINLLQYLETFFRIFILLTPLLFINIYKPYASNKINFTIDMVIGLSLPVIFIPFFVILFGLNPNVMTESEITGFFNISRGVGDPFSKMYFALGNSTSISPGLSILFLYFVFKAIYFYKIKYSKISTIYGLIGFLIFYTNWWFQQRIILAILLLLFLFFVILLCSKKKYYPIYLISIPIFLTFLFTIIDFDVRSELWRQAFYKLDTISFLLGMGLDGFKSLELRYSHPHNIFILFLFEYGFFGFLTFLSSIFAYCFMLSAIKLQREHALNDYVQYMPIMLFAAFIICITFNSNLIAYEYWVAVLGLILPIKLVKDIQ